MAMIEIDWNPPRKTLRDFGLLCLLIFGAIAASLWWKNGWTLGSQILAGAAVAGGVLGLLAPQALRPIFVGWMIAAFPIGWTISHLLLGAIYYLLLTPLGLLMRAFGYDPMNRKLDRQAKSYWIEHDKVEVGRYFRQF
ncbi:MAG TPA: SxtJ family membrane protein [Candidatus Limnocylindrales bacterium]|nr:SxtJ family membrane protein [Candidatus Limnocylindrales bacterium]